MELLPLALRLLIPPRGSQKDELDPIVYVHFLIPDSPANWYVAEGDVVGDDYVFYGFHMASESEDDWGWCEFLLSTVEGLKGPAGSLVVRDPDFVCGRFTEVVPHPYPDG